MPQTVPSVRRLRVILGSPIGLSGSTLSYVAWFAILKSLFAAAHPNTPRVRSVLTTMEANELAMRDQG